MRRFTSAERTLQLAMQVVVLIVVVEDLDEALLPYRDEHGTLHRTSLSVVLGSIINTRNVASTKYSTMGYYERVSCLLWMLWHVQKRVFSQAVLIEPCIRHAEAVLMTADHEKSGALKLSNQYEYSKAVLTTMRKSESGELIMRILRTSPDASEAPEKTKVDADGFAVPSNSSDMCVLLFVCLIGTAKRYSDGHLQHRAHQTRAVHKQRRVHRHHESSVSAWVPPCSCSTCRDLPHHVSSGRG